VLARKLQLAILAAGLAIAGNARASIELTLKNVSPENDVNITIAGFTGAYASVDGTIDVKAGVYNLIVGGTGPTQIGGVTTPSYCVDVSRQQVMGQLYQNYSYASITSAPLTPAGPMSAAQATIVEKLWTAYDGTSAGANAAALQLAIWEELGNGSIVNTYSTGYTVTASGSTQTAAQAMITSVKTGANDNAVPANLEILVSTTGQNYLVPNTVPVPEPTTLIAGAMLLLPFGASTLRTLRRNRVGTANKKENI